MTALGTEPPVALAAAGLRKSYGHVKALRGASLEVRAGEVVAIVGDNGAGKSTFISCICGAVTPDEGEVRVDGNLLAPGSIVSAMSAGLAAVYQDLAVAPHLSVVENIFLSTEVLRRGLLGRLGFLDRRTMRRQSQELMHELGIDLPNLDRPVDQLSGGQRQVVAVARAVSRASRVVVLDEPTAALGARQARIVLDTIDATRRNRIAVLLVSHDLPRVLEIADRIVVMRLGAVAAEVKPSATTVSEIVALMLGEHRADDERRAS
jgi:ABC-type sugar transport system ATPase subunit